MIMYLLNVSPLTVSGRNEKHEKGSITNLTLKNLNCDIYLREAMAFLYVPKPPPPLLRSHVCRPLHTSR